ncbi:MAG: LysR family transcriptional regulator [Arenibacterium sp.]
MNFTQISTLRAVMTSESLSDAAIKLGRTQPAVSSAIKALEEQLGLQLFERRGRKLIPVPEAQYLLAEADEILSQMARVRQTMQSLSVGRTGTLNVAAMPGPVSLIFPKFIARQLSEAESVSVSIQARTSNQIAELTRAQAVDFGFADAPQNVGTETLYQTEIIDADCLVAVPDAHPLAAKDTIGIEHLDGEPLGTLPLSHAHSVLLQNAFDHEGAKMHKTVESQTFLPVLHFVAAGRCCTVLDPLSVFLVTREDALVRGVTVKPMQNPIRYEYALYSPRYRPISVVAQNLREAWRAEVVDLLEVVGARPQIKTSDSAGSSA